MAQSLVDVEMAEELEQLKKCFDAMELDCGEIESAHILTQWLERQNFEVASSIAGTGCFNSEITASVTCPKGGIEYSVRCATANTFIAAQKAAKAAQLEWGARDMVDKIKVLYKVAHSFERHAKLFATADATCYPHKRFEKCRETSVKYSIEYLYAAARGKNFSCAKRYDTVLVVQDKLNTPVHLLPEWHFAQAVTCNCALILVVPTTQCLPALVFSDICTVANLPAGLFNVVVTEPEYMNELWSPNPSPNVYFLELKPNESHLSTSIIAEGADLHSAINGAFETLADCWGMPKYFGVMLYVQDCHWLAITRLLQQQAANVKISKHNFAKTLDLVSETNVRVVTSAQVSLEDAAKQPTIFVQGFKTAKDVCNLVSTGPFHSDCLSIWTEFVGVALEIADRVSGYRNIWVNGQNYFDNNVKSMRALLLPGGSFDPSENVGHSNEALIDVSEEHVSAGAVDQSFTLFYGGAQKLAESKTFYPVYNRYPPFDEGDKVIGYVPAGGPKDVRNAVEAAAKAFPGWSKLSPLQRSKYMYSFAEVLSERSEGLQNKLAMNTGHSDCAEELECCVKAAFLWAGSCGVDDWSSEAPAKMKVLQSCQPHGVVGILCPHTRVMESLISLLVGAISIGNTVVLIVPEDYPLAPLTLIQVIEHCKIPAGVINLLTGPTENLLMALAGHQQVASLWCWSNFRTPAVEEACEQSKRRSVWWFDHSTKGPNKWEQYELEFHRSYEKTIWIPCSSVFAN